MFIAQPTGTVISWQDDIARKEGTTWNRKTLMEGFILQWMDKV